MWPVLFWTVTFAEKTMRLDSFGTALQLISGRMPPYWDKVSKEFIFHKLLFFDIVLDERRQCAHDPELLDLWTAYRLRRYYNRG